MLFRIFAIVFSAKFVSQQVISQIISNDSTNKNTIEIYWNIPTFQCDSHKINFTELTVKYNIKQNENDRFRGDIIDILYDPGSFPAILKSDGSKSVLRNGGVPQLGNLTLHLNIFEQLIKEFIPNENFSGIAVIDFESWRPIFRQNFGTLQPYKDLSISVEKRMHPIWIHYFVEKEAAKRFEFYGRQFIEETIIFAKKLRPQATWGYYAYPYCFNMSPNNLRRDCPREVLRENEQLSWLFEVMDNYHPSLYLMSTLSENQKIDLIKGRINEANRISKFVKRTPKILPYFWYKYHDSKLFLSQNDLYNSFTVLKSMEINGLILWGSSNDVNTKEKCFGLYRYINETLGPLLNNTFN